MSTKKKFKIFVKVTKAEFFFILKKNLSFFSVFMAIFYFVEILCRGLRPPPLEKPRYTRVGMTLYQNSAMSYFWGGIDRE